METTVTLKTKTTVSFEQLVRFITLAQLWLRKKPENINTKIGYAIKRMVPVVSKLIRPLNKLQEERDSKIEKLKLDHCYVNPTTKVIEYDIIKDAQGAEQQVLKYTSTAKAKLDELVRPILTEYDEVKYEEKLKEEVTIPNPYFTTDVPADLTEDEKEVFNGIVIPATAEQKPLSLDDVRKAISGVVDDATFKLIMDKCEPAAE